MDEWLRWALTVPLAGAFGLLWLVPPVPRWRRRLKRAHAMAEALPAGPEREHFDAEAIAIARLIINYTTMLPLREKAYSWVAVVLLGSIIAMTTIDPIGSLRFFIGEGIVGWGLAISGLIAMGPAVVGAIAGRSAQGMDPEHYQDYMRRQVERSGDQRQWLDIRLRARRVRAMRRTDGQLNSDNPANEAE